MLLCLLAWRFHDIDTIVNDAAVLHPMAIIVMIEKLNVNFITNLSALRHLTSAEMLAATEGLGESLRSGGVLWFTDLTKPDETLIVPAALALVNIMNVEVAT